VTVRAIQSKKRNRNRRYKENLGPSEKETDNAPIHLLLLRLPDRAEKKQNGGGKERDRAEKRGREEAWGGHAEGTMMHAGRNSFLGIFGREGVRKGGELNAAKKERGNRLCQPGGHHVKEGGGTGAEEVRRGGKEKKEKIPAYAIETSKEQR